MAAESKRDTGATTEAPSVLATAILTGDRNPRGIPSVLFLEDIDAFVKETSAKTEEVFEELQNLHSKYKFMEAQLLENRSRLKTKIPDIQASLECVAQLREKEAASEDMSTFYNLSDNVYVPATVTPCNKVCLWMGANVMLEYSYEEAENLLKQNLSIAETKLTHNTEDLAYLRDQVITTEVNMARVFNHDVKSRRNAPAEPAAVTAQ